MLAADKLQLQSTLKQQATLLKEKEFRLHHENLMTVGTQGAVLAGLDITLFAEFTPSADSEWQGHLIVYYVPRILKFFYYVMIISAFCCNILVVAQTCILSVMSASIALRGPDGSMMVATDGLYEERASVFKAFAYGIATTMCAVLLSVWLMLSPEAAFVCMVITMFTVHKMYQNFVRVRNRFQFSEEDTVDFNDFFSGPASIKYSRRKSQQSRYVYNEVIDGDEGDDLEDLMLVNDPNNTTAKARKRGARENIIQHV